jgi:hypothetical protein
MMATRRSFGLGFFESYELTLRWLLIKLATADVLETGKSRYK